MLEAPNSVSFSARYPSAFRSVAEARHAVADFALGCGFDLAAICDIALAVGEACNNAAEHGHSEAGNIEVRCSFKGLELEVAVSDKGCGFDPGVVVHEPTIKGDRGLGIFLMRTLMDDIGYECTSGGTTVRLVKRRHA